MKNKKNRPNWMAAIDEAGICDNFLLFQSFFCQKKNILYAAKFIFKCKRLSGNDGICEME